MKKSKETRTNRNRKNTCFFAITGIVAVALITAIMVIPAAAQLADTPWPMFHHDLKHTGLSPYTGPDTSAIKWTYQAGGWVSPPVIGADGTVYVGRSIPGVGGGYLCAINPDGTLKWEYETIGTLEQSGAAIGSDGTVYFGGDENIYALNPDGTEKWKYHTGPGNALDYSRPAIGPDGTIYVGSYLNKLYAMNPDGTLKWTYEGTQRFASSPAIGSDGTIYVGSKDKKLHAVNPDGTLKWTYETGNYIYIGSSPAIGSDGTIYVGSKDTKLYAINPDGTLKWTYETGGCVYSTPAIGSDGTIYVGSYDHKLYAINPDGTFKWSYETGDRIRKSSAAVDAAGTIYIGSQDKKFYAINPDGTLKWSYETGDVFESTPAIGSDGTVYIGPKDNKLYAFGPGPGPTPTPDLVVTDINAYHWDGAKDWSSPWFNLSNEIDVTVKNNGSADAGASNVSLYNEDEFFGKLPVSGLSAGASETVTFENWKPVGDDPLAWTDTAEGAIFTYTDTSKEYTLKAVADADEEVSESNESNNNMTVPETVTWNGYMADEPLENYAHGKVRGGIIYTTGDGMYHSGEGQEPGTKYGTYYEVNYDLEIPSDTKLARLYFYYTWAKPGGKAPKVGATLKTPSDDIHVLNMEKSYSETAGSGAWNLPWGTYAYDITEYVTESGTYVVNITNLNDPDNFDDRFAQRYSFAAPAIVVVYENETMPERDYWINEGADVLIGGLRGDGGFLAWWECINNATFPASSETAEVVNATLGVVSPWGGASWTPGMTNYLHFNDIVLGQAVYHGYFDAYSKTIDSLSMEVGDGTQVGVNVTDVTAHYIKGSDNVVGQVDDGDCMMPSNAFLVVEYEEEGICGDVNEDGAVDFIDVGLTGRHKLYGDALADEWAADVNNDGSIDFIDVGLIGRHKLYGAPLCCK